MFKQENKTEERERESKTKWRGVMRLELLMILKWLSPHLLQSYGYLGNTKLARFAATTDKLCGPLCRVRTDSRCHTGNDFIIVINVITSILSPSVRLSWYVIPTMSVHPSTPAQGKSEMELKLGQIGPKWVKLGVFKISFSTFLLLEDTTRVFKRSVDHSIFY